MPDGSVYEGEIKNSLANGFGKFLYKELREFKSFVKWGGINFNSYQGNLKNGVFNGSGKLFEGKNLVFEGNFKDGLMDGYGKEYGGWDEITLIYEGEYEKGHRVGNGKEYYSNGKLKYEGTFNYDDYSGNGKKYDEEDGTYWLGDFESHYLVSGTLVVEHKTVYEGEFEKEVRHGRGVQFIPEYLNGYWENGEFIGNEPPDWHEDYDEDFET